MSQRVSLSLKKFIFHCSFYKRQGDTFVTLTQYGKNLIMSEYWRSFAIHWLSNRIERIMSRRGRARCFGRWTYTWLSHFAAQTLFCTQFFNFSRNREPTAVNFSFSAFTWKAFVSIMWKHTSPILLNFTNFNNSQTFKLRQSSILKWSFRCTSCRSVVAS